MGSAPKPTAQSRFLPNTEYGNAECLVTGGDVESACGLYEHFVEFVLTWEKCLNKICEGRLGRHNARPATPWRGIPPVDGTAVMWP
jgi:hypothetical protein